MKVVAWGRIQCLSTVLKVLTKKNRKSQEGQRDRLQRLTKVAFHSGGRRAVAGEQKHTSVSGLKPGQIQRQSQEIRIPGSRGPGGCGKEAKSELGKLSPSSCTLELVRVLRTSYFTGNELLGGSCCSWSSKDLTLRVQKNNLSLKAN